MKRITVHTKKKWWELRNQMDTEQAERKNPMIWVRLLMDIIENLSHVPKKYKWPMVHAVIKNFKRVPSVDFPLDGYLTAMYHEASILRHQSYGEKRKFMWGAFTELLNAVEFKIYEKSAEDKSVRSKVHV